jgi:tetratricopeptide (TPR) repeat protein
MRIMLIGMLLVAGADYETASIAELRDAVETAHRTWNLDLAQELITPLKQRLNTAAGDAAQELRWLLARDALLTASLLRNTYEKADTDNAFRRELGQRIDDAASTGFSALGGLPESSEKSRIMADLYMMMMRSKYKGKKYEDAMEKAADRAVELDPENPEALLTRSRRRLFAEENRGGDFEEGLKMVNRAIALDPDNEGAYILRALAYERHGMLDNAIADYQKALEINPEARPAAEHLERARAKQPGQ